MAGLGLGLGVAEFLDNSRDPYLVLDLNYAGLKSLGTRESFSRASSGTYFNASGVLTSAGTNVARFDHVYNGTSWVSRGLLVEEQRTNLHSNTSSFGSQYPQGAGQFSSGASVSPDGTVNAWKLYETDASSGSQYQRRFWYPSGVYGRVCYSVYAKAAERSRLIIRFTLDTPFDNKAIWFDLTSGSFGDADFTTGATGRIENLGNGWYRCSVTASSVGQKLAIVQLAVELDGSTVATQRIGDGSSGLYVAFPQLENGEFPTSFISCSGSATTRSADVCQITGGDFSGFYNASEGSIAVDFDRLYVPSSGSALFSIRDAGNNNAIYSYISGSQDQSEIYTSGVVATFNFGTPSSINILSKISTAYKVNDFAGSRNGSTALTDSSGAVPVSPTYMVIGNTSGSSYLNGHIARLRYYNARLTNARLQELST